MLFTGAGMMAPGPGTADWLVPKWDDLLEKLLRRGLHLRLGELKDRVSVEEVLTHARAEMLPYAQASLIEALFGKLHLGELRSELYRTLQQWCRADRSLTDEAWTAYPFLRSVVDLCGQPSVAAVVNYNFDDILESCMRGGTGERYAYSVGGARQEPFPAGALPIYHVHGYLPGSTRCPDPDEAAVVLTMREYLANMAEPYSWQTTTQLHFLRSAACLFLGVSMTDVNMLRVLQFAKDYSRLQSVYALMAERPHECGERPNGPDAQYVLTRLKATLMDDLGVNLIVAPDYEAIPRVVNGIRDGLERLRAQRVGAANGPGWM